MSRREGRDSHSKRLHSRSEREPSPKKPRRDGKPATEKTYSSSRHFDDVGTADRDQKQRRRLQDALPLEVPPTSETKEQPDITKEGLDRKADAPPDGSKPVSEPLEVPRSRSFFQHDERSSAGQAGRSLSRRATDHGRRSDPKEQSSDRHRDKADSHQPLANDTNVWRHDGFFELEAEAPPARKRPAFREKKPETEPETAAVAAASEPTRLPTTRKEERGSHYSRGSENKPERPIPRADERNLKRGDGSFQRGERAEYRGSYQSRDRFNGGIRGRDRFNGRYGERSTHRPGGFQVEKWKHDLFDEANRSPTPKNEEEQIAKVESLLAS